MGDGRTAPELVLLSDESAGAMQVAFTFYRLRTGERQETRKLLLLR